MDSKSRKQLWFGLYDYVRPPVCHQNLPTCLRDKGFYWVFILLGLHLYPNDFPVRTLVSLKLFAVFGLLWGQSISLIEINI